MSIYVGGTGTANQLDDYEEGTWTPSDGSGAGLSLTNNTTATYTKTGRFVHIQFDVTFPSTSNTSDAQLNGIPFNLAIPYGTGVVGWTDKDSANGVYCHIGTGNTVYMMDNSASNSSGTQHLDNNELSGKRVIGMATYYAAT